ncbi:hypothetical protein IG193_02795 [Infirmifilum lucidum]|uniref:Uncharacterized protein n=1 Tax=Infirmifilum lucidum TaxID=2776706 RepID=A0A7L9FI72_9CREN|nr:hypothetical protein [Infirmifilum lucidum]QOJ79407.1 hypothetical protein IG193_02795 [Infirmifilum lucidum]
MSLRVYRNEDVKRVIAFIPPGHRHVRVLIELPDTAIVLQEAAVTGIVRAYVDVATHPVRRAVELVSRRLSERKTGYAESQLVESGRSEEEVIKELEKLLSG